MRQKKIEYLWKYQSQKKCLTFRYRKCNWEYTQFCSFCLARRLFGRSVVWSVVWLVGRSVGRLGSLKTEISEPHRPSQCGLGKEEASRWYLGREGSSWGSAQCSLSYLWPRLYWLPWGTWGAQGIIDPWMGGWRCSVSFAPKYLFPSASCPPPALSDTALCDCRCPWSPLLGCLV